jgi:hypothetical protein
MRRNTSSVDEVIQGSKHMQRQQRNAEFSQLMKAFHEAKVGAPGNGNAPKNVIWSFRLPR